MNVNLNDFQWTFYVILFLGQVEVDIYLYGERHDIYDEDKDNIFGEGHIVYLPEVCTKLLNIL